MFRLGKTGGIEKVEREHFFPGAHRSRRTVHQLKFWDVQTNGDTYTQRISKLCKSLPLPLDSKRRNRFKKKLSERWTMEQKGRDSSYCSGGLQFLAQNLKYQWKFYFIPHTGFIFFFFFL